VALRVGEIATDIRDQLNGVQTQSRSITQLVAQLPSEQIDAQLPALIDQYGNGMVFGGGIGPCRTSGRRDAPSSAPSSTGMRPTPSFPTPTGTRQRRPTISISPGTRPVSRRPVASVPGPPPTRMARASSREPTAPWGSTRMAPSTGCRP
jgi:hypothetical protein